MCNPNYNPDDFASDSLDADPRADADVIWIENEDGSGQWSDGWTGGLSDEEYRNLPIEDQSMDAFAPGVIDDYVLDIDAPF
jgi:hypothetical protein